MFEPTARRVLALGLGVVAGAAGDGGEGGAEPAQQLGKLTGWRLRFQAVKQPAMATAGAAVGEGGAVGGQRDAPPGERVPGGGAGSGAGARARRRIAGAGGPCGAVAKIAAVAVVVSGTPAGVLKIV